MSVTKRHLLRVILAANAVFSGICGLLLVLLPGGVSSFIGFFSSTTILIVGVGLLLFALDLLRSVRQPKVTAARGYYFAGLDFAWVIGTATALWIIDLPFTDAGRIALLVVADVVAVFGVLTHLAVLTGKQEEGSDLATAHE